MARKRAPAKLAGAERLQAERLMRLAIYEAEKGLGRTSPNPVVGALLVKNGRIVGRGYHRKAGMPHAEVVAIADAGRAAKGADLYSTLEPCDHFGRTPPCTEAILKAGVARVFFASGDPNPLVNGRGEGRLRKAGLPVYGGVLKGEADRLNRPFFHLIATGLPFVTLKAAVTLDGKLATATGDSKWVTGEAARKRVHQLRDRVDAVIVGANTVELDDPQLTARVPKARDPLRVVVDSNLRTSVARKIYRQKSAAKTVIATLLSPASAKAKPFAAAGVEIWQLPARDGRVDIEALLRGLAKAGALHVLVEGGAELFSSFLREGLGDELLLFLAPKLIGSTGLSWSGDLEVGAMVDAIFAEPVSSERLGDDWLLRYDL